MIEAARALQRFFAGFGLDAYGKNDVPEAARTPYISYEVACPRRGGSAEGRAWVWFRASERAAAYSACDALASELDEGGAALRLDDGVMLICGGEAREEAGVGDALRSVRIEIKVMRY